MKTTDSATDTRCCIASISQSLNAIRVSSSVQPSRRSRSWSTPATPGTTTVTPRPSASRSRARTFCASAPRDTEGTDATVTVTVGAALRMCKQRVETHAGRVGGGSRQSACDSFAAVHPAGSFVSSTLFYSTFFSSPA